MYTSMSPHIPCERNDDAEHDVIISLRSILSLSVVEFYAPRIIQKRVLRNEIEKRNGTRLN